MVRRLKSELFIRQWILDTARWTDWCDGILNESLTLSDWVEIAGKASFGHCVTFCKLQFSAFIFGFHVLKIQMNEQRDPSRLVQQVYIPLHWLIVVQHSE